MINAIASKPLPTSPTVPAGTTGTFAIFRNRIRTHISSRSDIDILMRSLLLARVRTGFALRVSDMVPAPEWLSQFRQTSRFYHKGQLLHSSSSCAGAPGSESPDFEHRTSTVLSPALLSR
jgi:hypothetical protein